ncbi:unnamed protein product [Ectocarpus sp. CCAP 1310/34]|nr:unnamed protein product [Ectocarpus sp. CCAP 1310/34]
MQGRVHLAPPSAVRPLSSLLAVHQPSRKGWQKCPFNPCTQPYTI